MNFVKACRAFAARASAARGYHTAKSAVPSKISDVEVGKFFSMAATKQLDCLRVPILPSSLSTIPFPATKVRIEILDPKIRIEKTSPTQNKFDISLPEAVDKEIVEPPRQIIEKRAARLIVIRRAKMKKHKWRKLQKKMKYIFARKRQRKELKKEKAFQAVLLAQIKEAERFDVEDYVGQKLKIAHWEKPITRVRGFFAPEWVIRDHLQAQEQEKRMKERIDECLKFKK